MPITGENWVPVDRRDRQALDQAVLVATRHPIDLDAVERWSQRERQSEHFREFAASLARGRDGN